MKTSFSEIVIIYNPKSTGGAQKIATKLSKDLANLKLNSKIISLPTKHAGHAEEIAHEAARKYEKPLIISVSGDGGFHEVVNGVKQSGNKNAVVAVEGAGNANDHWRSVHGEVPVLERLSNKPHPVSLLQLTISGPKQLERYAHSYIGIGLTAEVGKALNQEELNTFNEKRILLKELSRTKYFTAQIDGKIEKLDSLVAANINQMAKVIKLEKQLHLDSSRFRLIMHKHRRPWHMLVRMIGAVISADESFDRTQEFELVLLTSATVQCDGEVYELPKQSTVKITGIKAGLKTL